jgi:uncharacterized membrane protein (UPF0127 family)
MTGRWSRIAGLLLVGMALALIGCKSDSGEWVEINGHRFNVELAITSNEQFLGMGGRTDAPQGTGMLFIFPREAPREFVMRNCLIPLDIAFMDDDGKIVRTHTMEVEADQRGLTHYPSGRPASLVLEVAAGEFERLGIRTGQTMTLSPSVQRSVENVRRTRR